MINKRNNQCKMITDSVLTANLVGAIHESPLPMIVAQITCPLSATPFCPN